MVDNTATVGSPKQVWDAHLSGGIGIGGLEPLQAAL
jgi:tetrahydrodipicolinate N-succinyltransferase